MKKLSVGDIVKMSSVGKARYIDGRYNPHKGVGVVFDTEYDFHGGQCYRVKWHRDITNYYYICDLEVTSRMEENE